MFALVFIAGLAMGFSITAFSVVPFVLGFLVACGIQELHPQLVRAAWQRARALLRAWLDRVQQSVAAWRAHKNKGCAAAPASAPRAPAAASTTPSPSSSSSGTEDEIVEASASPRAASAPSSPRPSHPEESPVPRSASTPPPSLHEVPDGAREMDNDLLRPTATYA